MESLHGLPDRLTQVIADLQADTELGSLREVDISVSVRRVLRVLGWDTDNLREVKPEYVVGNQRVDYALFTGGAEQVFVEVKKGGEPLEHHQEQLLQYAFKENIRLALLTNGTVWWFYLPRLDVNWEQRRFATISLDEQDKAEIVSVLADVLSKENVENGSALQYADDLHKEMQRQNEVSKRLPEAWNQLIDEFDELIVARLQEKVGELCKHEPDENEVKEFLSRHLQDIRIPPAPVFPVPDDDPDPSDSVKSQQIRAFTFKGQRKVVNAWIRYYITFCEMLRQIDKDQFEKVLTIRGKGGAIFFSRNKGDLREPELIPGSDIYVEKSLSAALIQTRVGQVANHLGHPKPTVETVP